MTQTDTEDISDVRGEITGILTCVQLVIDLTLTEEPWTDQDVSESRRNRDLGLRDRRSHARCIHLFPKDGDSSVHSPLTHNATMRWTRTLT